jgi:biopolymer transport protein ExbD
MSASVGGKSKTIVLNLTSLIDICAILIIFLVMGTVIGQEEVTTPPGLKFPKSFNKENLENAPQIIVFNDEVDVKFLNRKIPIQTLRSTEHELTLRVAGEVQKYIEAMPIKLKSSGVLLNMVADSRVPYSVIYDVSKYFREQGFQSILFVAEGN